jgi:hypothetical protein
MIIIQLPRYKWHFYSDIYILLSWIIIILQLFYELIIQSDNNYLKLSDISTYLLHGKNAFGISIDYRHYTRYYRIRKKYDPSYDGSKIAPQSLSTMSPIPSQAGSQMNMGKKRVLITCPFGAKGIRFSHCPNALPAHRRDKPIRRNVVPQGRRQRHILTDGTYSLIRLTALPRCIGECRNLKDFLPILQDLIEAPLVLGRVPNE